jgi:hypothetical protein
VTDYLTNDLLASVGVGSVSIGLGIIIARLAGRASAWVMVFVTGRHDAREKHLDASHDKLVARLEAQIDSLTERFDRAMVRIDQVEAELVECRRKHAESEAELKGLRVILQAQGSMRQEAQVLIAADKIARKGRPE